MPADRPYQSNLLSFLNRQVQVAKDRTGIFWRTAKISATTALKIAVQGILYPFHAILKAAELVGKQLSQAQEKTEFWLRSGLENISNSPRNSPRNSPNILPSDTPLQNLLTALTQRQLASTQVGDADELTMVLAAEMSIQGVASRLSDRRLVLVTPKQQVLDVLSDSQALAIQKRISYEVALYLRWVRSRTMTADRPVQWIKSSQAPSLYTQSELAKSELASPIRIPTLWQDQPNLGFFSLPNLQDLPSLQELPNLLQAAFRYFFGRSGLGLTEAAPHYVRYQPSSPILIGIAQPATQLTAQLTVQSLQTATSKPVTPKPTQISAQGKRQKASDLIESFDCNPVPAPDWLETDAQHVGYNRTWLDHCVAWLDEILVRIEKTFLTIWASFLSIFKSR